MRATWLFVLLALCSCDARKFWGEAFLVEKTCTGPGSCFIEESQKGQICNQDTQQCTSCSTNTQCRSEYSQDKQYLAFCDSAKQECRECANNGECLELTKKNYVCKKKLDTDKFNTCTGCTTNTECQPEFIACNSDGSCRGCVMDSECSNGKLHCDTGQCKPCTKNADCESGLCNVASTDINDLIDMADAKPGECVEKAKVKFVERPSGACPAGVDGTKGNPYCDLTGNALLTRYLVVRTPKSMPTVAYTGLNITNGSTLTVIGEGDRTQIFVERVAASNNSKLTVAGVTVTATTMTTPIVNCTTNASLSLNNVLVRHEAGLSPNNFVNANCGQLTLDRCGIGKIDATSMDGSYGTGMPSNAAISVNGATDYRITNTALIANGSGGPAVSLNSSKPGVFAFNTVVGNFASPVINCATQANILASIVAKNTPATGQFGGSCTLKDVVVGAMEATATGTNVIKMDPAFATNQGTDKLTLIATDACCVDKIDGAAADAALKAITRDFFGKARLSNQKYDIGYHEF